MSNACGHSQLVGQREFCPDCGLSRNEVLLFECAPFLKDDETPAECIARNRRDVDGCLTMLIAERRKVEALRSRLADALEAQAREIADLQAGWQRTYDHDVARLQERLAAAERSCKTYDKDGKLLTVCHDLATAERERDSWRREAEANAEDAAHCGLYAHRLAAALDLLRQHGIHVEYKWCWCEPTVEDHREGK